MSVFKVRWEKAGGHVHCTLFCSKSPNMTYANCGTFCVRLDELEDLERAMSGCQFVERIAESKP